MTGTFDRQRAVFDFRKLVARHRAWQGRHTNYAVSRAPSAEHAEISMGDAMKVFFQLHPEHADNQLAIDADFGGQQCFTFSTDRWGETTEALSAAKPR